MTLINMIIESYQDTSKNWNNTSFYYVNDCIKEIYIYIISSSETNKRKTIRFRFTFFIEYLKLLM